MTRVEVVYTRPSTNVSWGPNIKSLAIQQHYQNEYVNSGFLVEESVTFSSDNLSMTRRNLWNDNTEILVKYKTDEIVQNWIQTRNEYNANNGITSSVPYEEFISFENHLLETGERTGPYQKID